jgi:hypothetical protein
VPRSRGTYEGAGLLNRIASRFRTTITEVFECRLARAAVTRRARSEAIGLDGERGQQSGHVGRADASVAILRTSCPPDSLAAPRAASSLGAARPADLAAKQSALALDAPRHAAACRMIATLSSSSVAGAIFPSQQHHRPSADPRPAIEERFTAPTSPRMHPADARAMHITKTHTQGSPGRRSSPVHD